MIILEKFQWVIIITRQEETQVKEEIQQVEEIQKNHQNRLCQVQMTQNHICQMIIVPLLVIIQIQELL